MADWFLVKLLMRQNVVSIPSRFEHVSRYLYLFNPLKNWCRITKNQLENKGNGSFARVIIKN